MSTNSDTLMISGPKVDGLSFLFVPIFSIFFFLLPLHIGAMELPLRKGILSYDLPYNKIILAIQIAFSLRFIAQYFLKPRLIIKKDSLIFKKDYSFHLDLALS